MSSPLAERLQLSFHRGESVISHWELAVTELIIQSTSIVIPPAFSAV
jgi:hypothetical protein